MTRRSTSSRCRLGEFTFPPGRGVRGPDRRSSSRTPSGTPGGVFLFDTGFAPCRTRSSTSSTSATTSGRAPCTRSLAEAGIDPGEITAVANCHLHLDHCGPELALPRDPDLRPAGRVGRRPRAGLHVPPVDRLPGRDYVEHRTATTSSRRASASSRRRATRPATSRSSSTARRPAAARRPGGLQPRRMGRASPARARARARRGTARPTTRSIARLQGPEPEAGPLRARPPGLAVMSRRTRGILPGPC